MYDDSSGTIWDWDSFWDTFGCRHIRRPAGVLHGVDGYGEEGMNHCGACIGYHEDTKPREMAAMV